MNNTKIKYLHVQDRIYVVRHISFAKSTIVAYETGLQTAALPPDEIFTLSEVEDFDVKLVNFGGKRSKIVDFRAWNGRKTGLKTK